MVRTARAGWAGSGNGVESCAGIATLDQEMRRCGAEHLRHVRTRWQTDCIGATGITMGAHVAQ
jgi:hypothetical protein